MNSPEDLFRPVDADQKKGAFASGVKAKTTTKPAAMSPSSPDSAPPDASDVTVCFGGKQYSSDKKRAVPDSATVASATASLAACTFNGNAVNVGGAAVDPNVKYPVLMSVCKLPIDGACVLAQSDGWLDKSGNDRVSVRLYIPPVLTIDANGVTMRTSMRKGFENTAIIQFGISKHFIDPDIALQYMVDRIVEEYGCDKQQARQMLQLHPRYAAMRKNLSEKLQVAKDNNTSEFLFEVRVAVHDQLRKPMPISSQLVANTEDPIFFGYHAEEAGCGGFNMFFEFKHKSKAFTPVTYTLAKTDDVSMSPSRVFPTSIKFKSPNKYRTTTIQEEDDSSISTKDSSDEENAKPKAKKQRRKKVPEDASVRVDVAGLSMEQISKVVSDLQEKMLEQTLQSQLSGNDSSPSPGKKLKSDSGDAASVDYSRATRATRGSVDREEKRKKPAVETVDDVSMADRTTRSATFTITPSVSSKKSRGSKGSKKYT